MATLRARLIERVQKFGVEDRPLPSPLPPVAGDPCGSLRTARSLVATTSMFVPIGRIGWRWLV